MASKITNKQPTPWRVGYYKLPEPEMDRLKTLAEREERPTSDLVRRAIRELLQRTA